MMDNSTSLITYLHVASMLAGKRTSIKKKTLTAYANIMCYKLQRYKIFFYFKSINKFIIQLRDLMPLCCWVLKSDWLEEVVSHQITPNTLDDRKKILLFVFFPFKNIFHL